MTRRRCDGRVTSERILNMGWLHFVLGTVGKCVDLVCFLLDLNFMIVNSLVRLLVTLLAFMNSVPVLLTDSLSTCANLALFYVIAMADGMALLVHGVIGSWAQLLSGGLEGCKMVGYLTMHLLLRTKELLHRGLVSGHGLLRQAWECCGILFSLLLYLVSTIINLLLIGTQNVYAALVGLLETLAQPLQKALELTLTVLTFFYSTLVGTSLILWTPFRLAGEFLSSLVHLLISVFLLNSYGLLVTGVIIASATVYMNPALMEAATQNMIAFVNRVPTLHRLKRTLHLSLERHFRELVAWTRGRLSLWMASAGLWAVGARAGDVRQGNTEQDVPHVEDEPQAQGDNPPDERQERLPGASLLDPNHTSCSSQSAQLKAPAGDVCKAPPAENLLTLLHEQEERKKCVICQDSTKTVVLLPCRHLCLCRGCTDILLRQPIYQHNCPLCRHMILQTMDVYL